MQFGKSLSCAYIGNTGPLPRQRATLAPFRHRNHGFRNLLADAPACLLQLSVPEVEINLIVSDRYLDLDAEKIDVAIRYTPRPPASRGWMPLFREHIFPVYSPGYAAQTPMENVADLLQERLLYLSGRYRSEGR